MKTDQLREYRDRLIADLMGHSPRIRQEDAGGWYFDRVMAIKAIEGDLVAAGEDCEPWIDREVIALGAL